MKVGQVSWYTGNYGTQLQAFALQNAVNAMGHECSLIPFTSSASKIIRAMKVIEYAGLQSFIKGYLPRVIQRFGSKARSSFEDRAKAFDSFIKDNLSISPYVFGVDDVDSIVSNFDAFVCGSDQIWNPSIMGFEEFFWLGFVPDYKGKFSYAPSLGSWRIHERDRKTIQNYLKDYKAISVREPESAEAIAPLCPREAKVNTVLDPTLLFDSKQWTDMLDLKQFDARIGNDDSYLFAYVLRGDENQRKFTENVAKSLGLRLVVYPYLEGLREWDDGEWGDERIFDDTPNMMISRIKNADIIITDSFHCSVFSILFEKNFYVLKKSNDYSSQMKRIDYLLNVCDLNDRFVDDYDSFSPYDYGAIADSRLYTLRSDSAKYLAAALESCETQL